MVVSVEVWRGDKVLETQGKMRGPSSAFHSSPEGAVSSPDGTPTGIGEWNLTPPHSSLKTERQQAVGRGYYFVAFGMTLTTDGTLKVSVLGQTH